MTPLEKAKELVEKFGEPIKCKVTSKVSLPISMHIEQQKQCAIIACEIKYHSLRELLFNLRACRVIESEKVYFSRVQTLLDEENEVKQEIEKL